ncbi:MAG: D-alanyl-D-alanine carboxypeptidase [bacterium]|nr:D-alanyl-D-alanine carboxypeptidase [bacterium]
MKKILIILLFFLCVKVNASIVVMDADSGRVLYSENMNERKLIASTTKIMTSIIALENGNLEDIFKAGREIREVNGSMIYIKENESMSLNDLLYGLMLRSGNDAAMVIANNVLGYDNFIAQMNIKAFKLGMNYTTFENPHGLNDNTKNYSTAYDLSLLMKYAINNEEFLKITSTKKYKDWYNKNELLSDYKYLISGKIGYTQKSGQVFVSAARKNNKTLIISSIDEGDKFNLHKKLYEKYFEMYDKYKILNKYTFSFKVKNKNNNHYFILDDFDMLMKKDEIDKLKIEADLDNEYVLVYLSNKLIHTEKLYKNTYNLTKRSKLKELLSFFKF